MKEKIAMSGNERQKWALISVYSKAGIVDFAQALVALGWKILASGGTAKHLAAAGIEVRDVADLVGGGAILGHRVVTLSREVHAGLLARDCEEDRAELEALGVPFIDLACVDFYPLADAIAKPGADVASVVESTDIGGPTMVRSAGKGGRIVICDPEDRALVIELLSKQGDVNAEIRQWLRAKAEAIVAAYCLDAARFHSNGQFDGQVAQACQELAYAENRNQNPATLFRNISPRPSDPLALFNCKIDSGTPSYITMADGVNVISILRFAVQTFRRNCNGTAPYVAIVGKHSTPSGAAFSWESPREAVIKAFLGDSTAAMGGEFVANFPIDDELGELLFSVPEDLRAKVGREKWGLDVLFAPEFSSATVELLGKREKRRLLANPVLLDPPLPPDYWMRRPVPDGFIRQRAPHFILGRHDSGIDWRPAGKSLGPENFSTLALAQVIAWLVPSNTMALAKDGMLLALMPCQQDRMTCTRFLLEKAGSRHDTRDSVFASDGFFPYAEHQGDNSLEGPELLVEAGCIGGVVPADGQHLAEVQEYFAKRDLIVGYLQPEDRGFSRH
jgi:phosphoribosylaminoimidazolecarboxamide formyltransferase/IMP cyclohydrolase